MDGQGFNYYLSSCCSSFRADPSFRPFWSDASVFVSASSELASFGDSVSVGVTVSLAESSVLISLTSLFSELEFSGVTDELSVDLERHQPPLGPSLEQPTKKVDPKNRVMAAMVNFCMVNFSFQNGNALILTRLVKYKNADCPRDIGDAMPLPDSP